MLCSQKLFATSCLGELHTGGIAHSNESSETCSANKIQLALQLARSQYGAELSVADFVLASDTASRDQ